ncbi:MAG: hypothetical protein AAF564_26380 [Bacteroidota bacterium]
MITACEQENPAPEEAQAEAVVTWDGTQSTGDLLFSIEGLAGPEAVRYDPDQDVYFVANFNGDPAGDANGFVSRVSAEGSIETLEYMIGTEMHPLHGARGMYIVDDLLWVADAAGIHGFNRMTGVHEAFVDFTAFEPGFINDIVQGPDGALYVTETGGGSRIFKVVDGEVTVVLQDEAIGLPNGITWDEANSRFVIVAWTGTQTFQTWDPETGELVGLATSTGGNYDGVEVLGGRTLVASQQDSSLYLVENGESRPYILLDAAPADIGIDTQRMRVAVPYVAANRVDVWALPGK